VLGLIPSGEPVEHMPEPSAPTMDRPPGLPEPEPGGWWTVIMDYVFYAIGTIVILWLLYMGGRQLYRNSGDWFRSLVQRILSFLKKTEQVKSDTGYTDEETGVFSWDTVMRRFRESRLGRLFVKDSEPSWDDLTTNQERIRWLYRRWLRTASESGYERRASLTPRETASDVLAWLAERASSGRKLFSRRADAAPDASAEELAEMYDRVRYGGTKVSDDEVAAARRAAEAASNS